MTYVLNGCQRTPAPVNQNNTAASSNHWQATSTRGNRSKHTGRQPANDEATAPQVTAVTAASTLDDGETQPPSNCWGNRQRLAPDWGQQQKCQKFRKCSTFKLDHSFPQKCSTFKHSHWLANNDQSHSDLLPHLTLTPLQLVRPHHRLSPPIVNSYYWLTSCFTMTA